MNDVNYNDMFIPSIDDNHQNNNLNSDENYQLTENTSHYLNNAYNNFIKSKRSHIFFDISSDNEFIGRITIELFDDIVPNTVENFLYMVKYNYKGSIFHRIIKNFVIQGGDFINGDGSGSQSIYGHKFQDENFNLKHDKKYLLSMANSGPDTNGCQFFITLDELPNLDNKHVVFGRILNDESKYLIDILSNVETDDNDKPMTDCMILNCGILDN